MKKLFTALVLILLAVTVRAEMVLVVEGEIVSNDTTIIVTEFEDDPISGPAMEWTGSIQNYIGALRVDITRTVGVEDELCVGQNCTAGNKMANETKNYTLAPMPGLGMSSTSKVFAHYFPAGAGRETIVYVFHGDVVRTVTVHYDYLVTALPAVRAGAASTKVVRNGQILILRDGKEYSVLGSKL